MTQTKFSISAAARITGYSRPTISRHIESKPISYEINEAGHKEIARDELFRVYGNRCKFDDEEKRGQSSELNGSEVESTDSISHVNTMQEQLIQHMAAEIEHLRLSLQEAMDYQKSVPKLLEDRTKTDTEKWQSVLDTMSEKISNATDQQMKIMEKQHEKETSRLRSALQRESKKSWLDKLFEKKRVGTGNRR